MWRWLGCLVIAIIVALNVPTEASAQTFTDVGPKHPYQGIIQDMQKRELINGYPDGTFRPDNKITRAHVAVLLDKALPLEAKTNEVIRYKDVSTSHVYYQEIMKVSQAGIFSGDPNGNFNPNAPITRKQMAKVLDLAFELNLENFTYFEDVEDDWGYLHIQALASTGITTGDKGKFNPNAPVTRAHYAVFLHRALNIPAEPNTDPNAALTKAQIVNLLNRIPFEVETTLVTHKFQASPFSKVRADLLNNATPSIIDSMFDEYYAEMCIYCDAYLFSDVADEVNYRFEVLENTTNFVQVRTVSFDEPLGEAFYLEYTFEKQAGKWKLSDHDWENLGAGSFNLTKEEALQIVKNNYTRYETGPVHVTYLRTSYEDRYDWYTDREYRREVYELSVQTGDGHYNVSFYPHNGFFDEDY